MGQAHCIYSQADLDQVQKEVGPITAAFIAADFEADFVRRLKDRHDFVIYVTSSGDVDPRVFQEAGAKEVIPISRVQEWITRHFGTDTTLAEREDEPEPKREGIFRRFFRWGKKKPEDHLADIKKGDREHLSSPSERDVVRSGVLVHASSEVTQALRRAGFSVVSDPAKAAVCVVQADKAAYVPTGLPVVVLSAGNLSDIIATSRIPGAVLARPEELVDVVRSVLKDEGVLEDEETEPDDPHVVQDDEAGKSPPQPQEAQLHVLPGGISERSATLPYHGVLLYVVSPSDAAHAGELAARLALITPGSALVCASGASTAALALGMAPEELVARDWRIPRAEAPVEFSGVTVWPVDPAKFLDVQDALPGALVSQIRDRFSLTIVDAAADLALAASAARNAVVAVIKRGGVVEEWLVNRWLTEHGARALVLTPGETLKLRPLGGGFVLEIVGCSPLCRGRPLATDDD